MLCPKCKTNNSSEAIFCINCGQKLKIVCPRCKTPNKVDAPNCTNCNLKLIRFCPVCSAPNNPLSLNCQSCKTPLLKKCPQCGAINLVKSSKCKKCSTPLAKKVEAYKAHPVIKIELVNYDFFLNEIAKKELAQKLVNKFFQSVLGPAKKHGLKVLKLAPNSVGVEFKGIAFKDSIDMAFAVLDNIQKLNTTLAKINAQYQIKMFLFEAVSPKHDFGEAFVAKTLLNTVCCDEKMASCAQNDFQFEKISAGLYKLAKISKVVPEPTPASEPKVEPAVEPKTSAVEAPVLEPKPSTVEVPLPAPVEQKIVEPAPVSEVANVMEQPSEVESVKEVISSVQESKVVADEVQEPLPEPIQQSSVADTQIPEPVGQEPPVMEPIVSEDEPAVAKETPQEPKVKSVEAPKETPEPHQAAKERPQEKPHRPSPRQMATDNLKNAIAQNQGGFVFLSAEPGFGKTTLINAASMDFQEQNLCLLQADCHFTLHNNSFATLQNLIRSMFALPVVNVDSPKIKATVENALRNNLNILDDEAIRTILNLLVPDKSVDENLDIEESKQKVIKATKVLFDAVNKMQKIVLIIEEIEFMDESSAQVFDELFNYGFLDNNFIIATASSNAHPSAVFQSEVIAPKTLVSIRLQPLSSQEIEDSLSFYIQNSELISDDLKHQIQVKTRGWPLFIEEIILFLTQSGFIYPDETGAVKIKPDLEQLSLPDNLEDLLAVRLDTLFQFNEQVHQALAHAICLGYMFYPPIIQRAMGIPDEEFKNLMQTLLINGICMTSDNVNFKFKNKFIFEVVQKIVIKDDELQQINSNLLNAYLEYTQANSVQLAFVAQNAGDYPKAFNMWATGVKECISTGDGFMYLQCQKGALNNIDYSDYPDKEGRKLAIYEQLGKANFDSAPEDAIDFLSKAIKFYDEQNDVKKVLELAGYLVKSLSMTGNIQEALGYLDMSIEYLNPADNSIEIALLKFLKLKFLIDVGNLGEVITLIQAEILPALTEGIKKQNYPDNRQFENIKETIIQSQIILIKALALQGNKNYYNAVETFASNNEITPNEAELFAIDALHKTFNGMPEASIESIRKTTAILKPAKTDNKERILLELEFIGLLNKFIYSDNPSIARDVAPIAQKAKKLNHSFIYNFLQVLFSKQLVDAKDLTSAANLVNDCLTYFSDQKIAIFAIPSWIVLSQIQASFGDYDQAISICQQALDVASKPQIKNNYGIVYIKKLLADYNIKIDDLDMAKMHLEEGLAFAKENELTFWEGRLYVELANLYILVGEKTGEKEQSMQAAKELYGMASEMAKTIGSKILNKIVMKESIKATA